MKAFAKLLSLLLVVAMCFGLMAVSASAEGAIILGVSQSASPAEEESAEEAPAAETPAEEAPAEEAPAEDSGIPVLPAEDEGEDEQPSAEEESAPGAVAVIVRDDETLEFASLSAAIAAAEGDDVVELRVPLTLSAPLAVSSDVIIDLCGNTLRFSNSGAVIDNAVEVLGGADLMFIDGRIVFMKAQDEYGNSYGFVNGFFVDAGGSLILDVDVDGQLVGGALIASDEDAAGACVIGGEYGFDPSAYLPAGYIATPTADGSFIVSEDEDGEFDSIDAATTGDNFDIASAVSAASAGGTVTMTSNAISSVTIDKDLTLDLGGFTLTGSVTVNTGCKVTIKNGTVGGSINNSGALTLAKLLVINNVACADGSSITVSTDDVTVSGSVTATGTVTGKVTAGTYNDIADSLIPYGYKKSASSPFSIEKDDTACTVLDKNNKAYNESDNYPQYFKGSTAVQDSASIIRVMNCSFVLSDAAALRRIKLNGATELTKDTDYKLDGSTVTLLDAAKTKFEALSAGKNSISFEFTAGTVEVPVFVWPSVELVTEKYVIGSGADFVIKLSDDADQISIGDKGNTTDTHKAVPAESLTVTSSTSTAIKTAYMDTVTAGTHYIGLWYDDMVLMYQVVVKPAPVLSAVDSAKWVNAGATLDLVSNAKITGDITVDGAVIAASNYTVSDTSLKLSAAYLKTLAYGDHTINAVTEDGKTANFTFRTEPSLQPKDSTNHTLGGSKDLVFVCSDPATKVYVGSTELKSDYYTISEDGKTITLKAAFLNTLKADTGYVVTALVTVNGVNYGPASSFKILSASSAASSPSTGDSGNIALWAGLLLLSGAGAAALLPRRKKQ